MHAWSEKKGKRQLPTYRGRACYHLFKHVYFGILKKFLLDCIGLQISEIKRMHLEHTPLRIFYGFLPSSIRFFFTDFLRISAGQLTDFLRIFYGFCRVTDFLRFFYGFLPGSLRFFLRIFTDFCRAAYGFFTGFVTDFCRAAYEFFTILLSLRQHVCL